MKALIVSVCRMIRAVSLACIILVFLPSGVFANDSWTLPDGNQVVFMDADSALQYMLQSSFMQKMTVLDVSLRMKKDLSASGDSSAREVYSDYLEGQVKDWSGLDKRYLRKQLLKISEQISAISPQMMPDTLFLIRTTGDQEFNAFYTIRKAIIVPGIVRTGSTWLPFWWTLNSHIHKTLIHEIYHIFSTEHPECRDQLYEIFGFSPIGDVILHPELRKRLITNPDDKQKLYKYTSIDSISNSQNDYLLLILSKYPTWEGYVDFPSVISVLLVYLDSKLHMIEFQDGEWRSVLDDNGKPILVDKWKLPGFLERIGLKNDLILSPEEIVAEYWVLAVESSRRPSKLKKYDPATINNLNHLLEYFQQLKSISMETPAASNCLVP